jgi:predicted lipoprotein
MKYRFSILPLALASLSCELRTPDEVVRVPRSATMDEEDASTGYEPPPVGDGDGDAQDDAGPVTGDGDAGKPVMGLDGGMDPKPDPKFSKGALLSAFAQCSVQHYEDLESLAQALVTASEAWAAERDTQHLNAARDAFVLMMDSLEEVEVFRFGPFARATEPGGKGLRDRIYAFPLRSTCKIDQQIVNQAYAADDFSASALNARGLGAFEYLAFHQGSGNSCGSIININANGSWAALSSDELFKRRADYAVAVAKEAEKHTRALVTAWKPSGEDFASELKNAGNGSSTYESAQAALNAVSDGIFYVEKEVKDWKLGWPLGLVPECVSGSCPEAVESPYAKISNRQIVRNFVGFRRLFKGCGPDYSGLGFDDWLKEVGAEDLATRMLAALDAAEEYARTMDPPIEQAITADKGKVTLLHTKLKALTDLMKGEFVTVLNLEPPAGVEGDND